MVADIINAGNHPVFSGGRVQSSIYYREISVIHESGLTNDEWYRGMTRQERIERIAYSDGSKALEAMQQYDRVKEANMNKGKR